MLLDSGTGLFGQSPQSDFVFVTRHRVLERPDYLFEIDEYRRGEDHLLLAHLRVHKFTTATMKAILRDWRLFREVCSAPLFGAPVDETGAHVDVEKWTRFVSLLGFRSLNHNIAWQGELKPLFLHHKDFHGLVVADHQFVADAERHQ